MGFLTLLVPAAGFDAMPYLSKWAGGVRYTPPLSRPKRVQVCT